MIVILSNGRPNNILVITINSQLISMLHPLFKCWQGLGIVDGLIGFTFSGCDCEFQLSFMP